MKLLIFGECSSEALSGKYPYDVDIQSISTIKDGEKPNGISVASILAVKLEKLGHDISLFDFTKIIPDFRDRSIISRIKLRLFVKFFDQKVSNELFEAVSRDTPESMIVFKGLNIQPSTLKRIKDLGVKLINWNPDYFFNPKNTNKNLLESIEYYDLIVSGRKHLTEEYKQKGMKNILFLDWYYIPELHYPEKSKIKYDKINVPGVFEIPVVIAKNIKKYDGFIALGCVIKGETPHFDFISKITIDAIMKLSIESRKPIGNGILTCINIDQANARSEHRGLKRKGREAAVAMLSVLSSKT